MVEPKPEEKKPEQGKPEKQVPFGVPEDETVVEGKPEDVVAADETFVEETTGQAVSSAEAKTPAPPSVQPKMGMFGTTGKFKQTGKLAKTGVVAVKPIAIVTSAARKRFVWLEKVGILMVVALVLGEALLGWAIVNAASQSDAFQVYPEGKLWQSVVLGFFGIVGLVVVCRQRPFLTVPTLVFTLGLVLACFAVSSITYDPAIFKAEQRLVVSTICAVLALISWTIFIVKWAKPQLPFALLIGGMALAGIGIAILAFQLDLPRMTKYGIGAGALLVLTGVIFLGFLIDRSWERR